MDLTKEDLLDLIWGTDHQGQHSHSGYDDSLSSDSLQSEISAALDPDKLEDPQKMRLWFDKPSMSITTIPELTPNARVCRNQNPGLGVDFFFWLTSMD